MDLIKPVKIRHRSSPKIWLISRIDQASLLADHLVQQNRLVRWNSFWRHDGTGPIQPSSRKVSTGLSGVSGRHLLPDLLEKAAQKLQLPARNLYSDIPLSMLAARALPKADILHGQGNYSLPAMRRAKTRGMITIADITGQLSEIRHQQLDAEYAAHNQTYADMSRFLARRRTAEARFCDAVFAPSEAVMEGLVQTGIAENKIYLVPFISPQCQALLDRQRPAKSDTVVRLLYVGNLSLAKGLAHLLAAWEILYRQFRQRIKLTLVGKLEPCATRLTSDLPDGVEWLGAQPREAVSDLMLASDIFVFPSLSEGSSLAVMEAMAAGCAVVTTFAAGSPIINQMSGLIVPSRDHTALAKAASTLISAPTMRRNLGQVARNQISRDLQTGYGARVDIAHETVMSRHG